MIVESSTSSPRDSKRSHNGFPAISNPDTPTKHDTLATAGPSNEPPPPTYEEAVSVIEASASSSTAGSASSSGFAPSQDKYAAQGGTTAFALSPYANPAVTGYYGAPAQTLCMPSGAPSPEPETSRVGRHASGASYYAPSTSSGMSRPSDSGFAPSPTLSSHSSLLHPEDGLAGASVARSSSASTTHTASSGASRASHPAARSPSDRGPGGPQAEGPWDPHTQAQASTSTRRAQSFARAPANGPPYAYGPFPPATLHARSDDLQAADGFPREPPTCACACAPHPFVTHDVREEDWARFLDDVRRAGGLAPVSGFVAGAAPVAVRVGIVGGLIAGHALRAHIKSKRKSPVADVVDEWNRKFFHPRCMDVVLAQGVITYTGPANALPPDIAWRTKDSAAGKHVKAYEDTSDDDDDESSARGIPGTAAVGSVGRRLNSMGRRLDSTIGGRGKRGRIALSQDLKASAGEAWRLVVSYNPPVL